MIIPVLELKGTKLSCILFDLSLNLDWSTLCKLCSGDDRTNASRPSQGKASETMEVYNLYIKIVLSLGPSFS